MGKGIFDIDIFKLANGEHSFDFDFDSEFFDLFEDSIIEKGHGHIHVLLGRSSTLINLAFDIKADVELICDRSLDKFNFQIQENKDVRLKFSDHAEELSEDLYLIESNTQKIDISQFVYEFISLAIPMKKLHPRFNYEEDEGIIFSSAGSDMESSNNSIDPRWNELKKIKRN